MIGVLFRRELLDHLMSLRFALILLITVALMAVNAVVFCASDHGLAMEGYREQVKTSDQRLQDGVGGGVARLAERGPGSLHKMPSPLAFAASGRDSFLPATADASSQSSYGASWGFMLWMPWHLRFGIPQAPPSAGIAPDFVEVDWVFVVGFCLSLMALLLTYDGVCGERQAGTLRLLLSGPVPRHAVLLGKFAAAWAVLAAALAVGLAVNLLVIVLSGPIEVGGGVWARAGVMYAASLLYLAFFVGLGLFVSARSDRPAASLVSLLLVWTVLLVLLPNTTAGVASYFAPQEADWKGHHAAQQALFDEHQIWKQSSPVKEGEPFPYDYVKIFSAFLRARLLLDQEWEEAQLRGQLRPVELGRALNRLSPYGVFQYAMESLAGTGLPRHLRLHETARRYDRTFRQFLDERDQADPASHHLFGLAAGLSTRPVTPEAVPRFREDLSAAAAMAGTGLDLALLGLFALVGFMAAHAAFLRADVA